MEPTSNNTSRNVIIGIVVIIIIAIIGYFAYASMNPATPESTNNTDTTNSTGTTDTEHSSMDMTSTSTTGTSASVDTSVSVGTGSVKSFTITGSNFKFAPATMTVKKGDTVKITFVNSGGIHDLTVDGYSVKTKQLTSGQSETIQFVASKSGTFEYYCSVGTHRQMGMKGTLTVQ